MGLLETQEGRHPNVEMVADLLDAEAYLFDGFEDALIGAATQFGRPAVACYSLPECLRILQDRDGMTEEEAEEYLDFNMVGAYIGEYTPVFFSPPLGEG